MMDVGQRWVWLCDETGFPRKVVKDGENGLDLKLELGLELGLRLG